MASGQPQQVNVADLDLPQLVEVKKQLDEVRFIVPLKYFTQTNRRVQELSHLTNSFAQLKQAQAKFKACIDNVQDVKPQNTSARFPL